MQVMIQRTITGECHALRHKILIAGGDGVAGDVTEPAALDGVIVEVVRGVNRGLCLAVRVRGHLAERNLNAGIILHELLKVDGLRGITYQIARCNLPAVFFWLDMTVLAADGAAYLND